MKFLKSNTAEATQPTMKNTQSNRFIRLFGTFVAGALLVLAQSCTSDPNSPGVEYMPDMYRSPSIETYVDYGVVGDSTSTELVNTQSARLPAPNTVPRGWNVYPYDNNLEGYEAAGEELMNPLVLTKEVMEEGKVVYGKFCVHCHGTGGKGDGKVAKNAKYNAVPPAYDSDELKNLEQGKMFHSIHYGKNKMGSHAGQISWEDRWKVVTYVKYKFMQKELGDSLLALNAAEEGDVEAEVAQPQEAVSEAESAEKDAETVATPNGDETAEATNE